MIAFHEGVQRGKSLPHPSHSHLDLLYELYSSFIVNPRSIRDNLRIYWTDITLYNCGPAGFCHVGPAFKKVSNWSFKRIPISFLRIHPFPSSATRPERSPGAAAITTGEAVRAGTISGALRGGDYSRPFLPGMGAMIIAFCWAHRNRSGAAGRTWGGCGRARNLHPIVIVKLPKSSTGFHKIVWFIDRKKTQKV